MQNSNLKNGTMLKIYIVLALCLVVFAETLVLIFSDMRSQQPEDSSVAANSSVVTPSQDPVLVQSQEPVLTSTEEPTAEPTFEPTETPEPTEEPTAEPEPQQPQVDVYTDSSMGRIVNKEHPIPADYVPEDLSIMNVKRMNGEQQLREEAARALEEMYAAAENDGIYLFVISGYRSYGTQQELYNQYVAKYGEAQASRIDAYPGTSEHQLGLSVDLGAADRGCELRNCFKATNTYEWLQHHSWEYGYIERNPVDSEQYTGVQYSPWNFRYVGRETASLLHDAGMSMEQYFFTE